MSTCRVRIRSGLGIEQFVERDRRHVAARQRDERAAAAADQVANRAVPERAGVVDVERNRLRAAQLVADVLREDRRVDPDLGKATADAVAQHAADWNVGDADVPECIALDALERGERARRNAFDDAFGNDRDAVLAAERAAFDDRAHDRIDDQCDVETIGKLLGQNGERCTGRLAHP